MTLQRTFLGIRYECLVQRNLRVMENRVRQSLVVRAFSGWRYHGLRQKTRRVFECGRERKDLSFFFFYWLDLRRYLTSRKDLLRQVVLRKDSQLKTSSFLHWRRQAYRETFHDAARRNIVYPIEVANVRRCLIAWRRFARCNVTRHAKEQHL